MRKSTIICLILAAALILAGAGILTAMLAGNNWDLGSVNTVNYQNNTYTSTEDFQDIVIDTTTADISFYITDSEETQIVCYEMEKLPHSVSFDSGKLIITENDNRKWYDHIGISFSTPTIKIYLPKAAYNALNIDTTTGSITIPGLFRFDSVEINATTAKVELGCSVTGAVNVKTTTGAFAYNAGTCGTLTFDADTGKSEITNVTCQGDIRIKLTTGKSMLSNVTCANLSTEGTTGDITLSKVIVNDALYIKRTTGDVKLTDSDGSRIRIQLSTGDVTGNFLTGKTYTTSSTTGNISVPDNSPGGICEITTTTGNIKITAS